MGNELVFIDTETTGLDVELHRIWEVALITSDDSYLMQPSHVELSHADPNALELNGFFERYHGYVEPAPPTKVMHTDIITLQDDQDQVGGPPHKQEGIGAPQPRPRPSSRTSNRRQTGGRRGELGAGGRL